MKFAAVILFALIAACYATIELDPNDPLYELKKVNNEYELACVEEEQVDPVAADNYLRGQFENRDPKIQRFAKCFQEKLGFLKDGKAQPLVILKTLVPLKGFLKISTSMAKCAFVGGADEYEKAFNSYKCFFENGAVSF